MDPVTIASLVSSIITILKTTQEIYDAAHNQSGLPEAFQVVATRLDAVTTILPAVGASIEHVDEIELKQSLVRLLRSCESQSTSLHEIFDKVVPAADASRLQRYLSVAWAMKIGRAARVEDLMKSIITDMHTISMDLGFRKSASEVQSLLQAQEAVEKLEPSLPDEELDGAPSRHVTTNNNTGSGNLYNASGSGNMTNFSNNASQHNYSGSAPVHHVRNATYGKEHM